MVSFSATCVSGSVSDSVSGCDGSSREIEESLCSIGGDKESYSLTTVVADASAIDGTRTLFSLTAVNTGMFESANSGFSRSRNVCPRGLWHSGSSLGAPSKMNGGSVSWIAGCIIGGDILEGDKARAALLSSTKTS